MLDSHFQNLLWFSISFFFYASEVKPDFQDDIWYIWLRAEQNVIAWKAAFFFFFAVLQGVLHLHSVLAVLHLSLTLFAFYVHSIISALIITHAKAQFSLISLPHPFASPPLKKMMKSYIVLLSTRAPLCIQTIIMHAPCVFAWCMQ